MTLCKHGKDGFCRACYVAEWRKRNPDYARNKMREYRGGLKMPRLAERDAAPCKHGRIGACKTCWQNTKRQTDPEYRVREKTAAMRRKQERRTS